MARQLQQGVTGTTTRPETREDRDALIRTGREQDVDEFIRRTLDEHGTPPATRRPVRWMRWTTLLFVAALAALVVVLALPDAEDAGADYRVPRTADGTAGWVMYLTPEVPRTADGTEQWLEAVGTP